MNLIMLLPSFPGLKYSKDMASTSAPAGVLNAGSDGDATDYDGASDESGSNSSSSSSSSSAARQPQKPVLRKHGKLISFFR